MASSRGSLNVLLQNNTAYLRCDRAVGEMILFEVGLAGLDWIVWAWALKDLYPGLGVVNRQW